MSNLKIEWRGEILSDIGYGLQARRILKPLIESGIDVKLIQAEDYVPDHRRITDPYWLKQLEDSKAKPDAPIRISYEIPSVSKYRQGAINIAYVMWETDKYPREWIGKINEADIFFVGCPALVESAKKAGVDKPIYSIMPPLDLDTWCPEGPVLGIDGIKDNDAVFIVNANWIPRKNFGDLLVAFCCAFNGVKDVVLVIKTWGGDNSAEFKRQIKDNVAGRLNSLIHIGRPRVLIVSDILPEAQIVKLMRRADAYVTASHGEGFDLPMVQAMALGKVIVSTRYLAHEYYMNSMNSFIVNHTMVPVVDAKAAGYSADQMWSRPDIGDFMKKLAAAYTLIQSKSGELDDMKAAARRTMEDKFHKDVIVKNITDTLTEIASTRLAGV